MARRGQKLVDLTGKRFNAWYVEGLGEPSKDGHPQWRCRCICGAIRNIQNYWLRSKKNARKSCGCLYKEDLRLRQRTHGMTGSREYMAWRAMRARCSRPKIFGYERYGGRGIRVCERWQHSFENFLADMGPCPAGKSLERIDNDGNYEPSNCKWATRKEQARNRSTCRLLTYFDATRTKAEWADLLQYCDGSSFGNALHRRSLMEIIAARGLQG